MAESGLNRVTLIGRLTADGELRFTQSQQAVLNFRLACTETWYDTNTKESKERTEFVSCTLWGKRGESLSKFLHKGSRVCVEGRLQTRSYEAKDGTKRYVTEIVCGNIVLLGDSKGGRREQEPERGGGADTSSGPDHFTDDSEIPF